MAEPFRVLCVCIGNVCRSPVAERLLLKRLEDLGVRGAFSVESAGTRALVGHAMVPESAMELDKRDGSVEGFVARRLNADHLTPADLVLTATTEVRRIALEETPGALRRTYTWNEFAALVNGRWAESPAALVAAAAPRRAEAAICALDTEDPIGRPPEVHARVAAEIDEAITRIATALARSAAI